MNTDHSTKFAARFCAVAFAMVLALLLLVWAPLATPAHAVGCPATVVVTSTVNAGDGSLRKALGDVCTNGTITFSPDLTVSGPATITLTTARLEVTKTVTISGPGAELLIVSGNNARGIFNIRDTGDARISGVTLRDAHLSGSGGAAQNAGRLTISNTLITNNWSSQYAGGIYSAGYLTVTGSTIMSNTSTGDGGGIYSTQWGGNPSIVFITDTLIVSNTSATNAGGVYNNGTLTMIGSRVISNTARYPGYAGGGGGILNLVNMTATLTNTMILNNFAGNYGGGVGNIGLLRISGSTIAGNYSGNMGGGISSQSRFLVLSNSTIAGNTAITKSGGILMTSGGLTMTQSTIAGNINGGLRIEGGALSFTNTIIANSTIVSDYVKPSASGAVVVNTGNLVADGSITNTLTGDPVIGDLGDYGGPTWTAPLLPGSPAIDAGSSTGCLSPDQRGVTRTPATCDIGAFESQRFTLTRGGGSGQTAVQSTSFANPFTLTVASGSWQGKQEPTAGGQARFIGPFTGAGLAPITNTATINTGGVAEITLTANDVTGAYQVRGVVAGASTPVTYTSLTNIPPVPTTTTLTIEPVTSTFGDIVTMTATVTATTGIPTGSINFMVDGLTTAQPLIDAVATITRSNLTGGVHPITASLPAGNGFAASQSQVVTATVQPASTGITVTSFPNPTTAQNAIAFTATVTSTAGVPTGWVTFTVGSAVFTATLDGDGIATQHASLVAGTHPVTATFADTGNFAGSEAVGPDQVVTCADVYTVDTTADAGVGSVRQGIVDACTGGEITFASTMTATGAATILLTSDQLTITRDITITGLGANLIKVSGNNARRSFTIVPGVTAQISALTIQDGLDLYKGAGINNEGNLTLVDVTVSNNTAAITGGGGIYNAGILTLTRVSLLSNTAQQSGAGVYNAGTLVTADTTFDSNSAWTAGGGIYSTGPLTLRTTTFNRNLAGTTGGGLHNTGPAVIANSTIENNGSQTGGGGIYNAGALTLTQSSVSRGYIGGINNAAGGTLNFTNTLIANTFPGSDCTNAGVIGVNTGNLVEDGTCSPALSGDPLLGNIGDYGGATETLPLLPGSRAIDAANADGCLPTDQRGVTRTPATCDIGAYETQGFTLTLVGGDNQRTPVDFGFAEPLTLTVTAGAWQGKDEPTYLGQVTFAGPAVGAGVTPITKTANVVSGGLAAITVTANSAGGVYSVTASLAGGHAPISYTLQNVMTTTTAITFTPAASVFGQTATFTATVGAVAGTPTGSVTVTVDSIERVLPLVNASATFTRSNLAVGDHALAAQYSGANDFWPSTSAAYTHTVGRASSTITVTSAPNPSATADTVTFTGTVSAVAPGLGLPTGDVTFTVGANVFTATLSNGIAVAQRNGLTVGMHAVSAAYPGDANFMDSTITGADQVVQAIMNVHKTGTGAGALTSDPTGVDCGVTCSARFDPSAVVTVTATPFISSTFTGWSGDGSGATSPVTVTMNANKELTATFAVRTFVITPTAGANGSITPSTPQTVTYAADQAFYIAPNALYRILDVCAMGSRWAQWMSTPSPM
ncbi:MAG: Ig-like domain repeat protein [Anaerolineales bacterium]|nr:Ig-like domain repeat protein [Anaerolineales bacterium]